MIVLNKGTYILNNPNLSDWGNSGTWTTQSLVYTCNGLECTELRIKSVNTNGTDGYKLEGYWTVNGGGYFTIYNSVGSLLYYTYIVITTDQEVDDSFHTWFTTCTTRMEDTPSVVGKWRFDTEPHIDQFENSYYNVKFVSDSVAFDQIEFYGNQQITEVDYGIVYNSTSNGSTHAYVANQDDGTSGWGLNQDIINIVEDPDDEQFKARLRDTATRLTEAKKLTRLFPGPIVAKSATRQLRKLTMEKPQESIVGTWVLNSTFDNSGIGGASINVNNVQMYVYDYILDDLLTFQPNADGSLLLVPKTTNRSVMLYNTSGGVNDGKTARVEWSGGRYVYVDTDYSDQAKLYKTLIVNGDTGSKTFDNWLRESATKMA